LLDQRTDARRSDAVSAEFLGNRGFFDDDASERLVIDARASLLQAMRKWKVAAIVQQSGKSHDLDHFIRYFFSILRLEREQ
jgi:hypothetical protein